MPVPRLTSSVQWKLAMLIFGVTVATTGSLAIVLPQRQLASAGERLDRDAADYGRLLARELEPVVAFGDRETAREVFGAIGQDEDVRGAAVLDDAGRPIEMMGELPGPLPTQVPDRLALLHVPGGVRVVGPVSAKEGQRGIVVLELSTASLDRERAAVLRATLLLGGAALACGLVAAWLIGHSIARRLRALADVTGAVALGNLSQTVPADPAADEVGQLSRSVDAMLERILELMAHIERTARGERERLETIVRQRTEQLSVRNRDMRLVLDNVAEGFLTLDAAGIMRSERSAILDAWFGPPPPDRCAFSDYVKRVDMTTGMMVALGWETLVDDILPREVAIAQLPASLRHGRRSYEIAYTPILGGEQLLGALVVIRDITQRLEHEERDEAQHDILRASQKLAADRCGMIEFLRDADAIVALVRARAGEPVTAETKRDLHTLKGNFGLFGLTSLARICNAVEEGMAERCGGPTLEECERLVARWTQVRDVLRSLLDYAGEDRLDLTRKDVFAIVDSLLAGEPRLDIARRTLALVHEPVERRLERLAEYARSLATRLDKESLKVVCESDGTRLDPEVWSAFWASLVHVVRNAIDHGVETADERSHAGKDGPGTLRLRVLSTGSEVTFRIDDDGRGIVWSRVRDKAQDAGLPHATQADLERAIFTDGLSTRDVATDVSGRGVGLAAVRAACEALRGRIAIESTLGHGTSFVFRFPKSDERSSPPVARRSIEMAAIEAS